MKFESQENVNNQTTTSEIENIENLKNTEIKQKCKKNLICKLAIITTSLIAVTLIVILIIVFLHIPHFQDILHRRRRRQSRRPDSP